MDNSARLVGRVPVVVVQSVQLQPTTRDVFLHPDTILHIRRRRPQVVDFILEHLAAAIESPVMFGEEMKDPRRLAFVYKVPASGQYLRVGLKIVKAEHAASASDEIWVSTAFPIGKSLNNVGNKPTLWRFLDGRAQP